MIAISNTPQPHAAFKAAEENKNNENNNKASGASNPDVPARATRDAYIPEEEHAFAGLYSRKNALDNRPSSAREDSSEECTGNTDKVDAKIRKLKEKAQKLEQEIAQAKDDPDRREKLQQQLNRIENELRIKDTDSYRRQHTKFSE